MKAQSERLVEDYLQAPHATDALPDTMPGVCTALLGEVQPTRARPEVGKTRLWHHEALVHKPCTHGLLEPIDGAQDIFDVLGVENRAWSLARPIHDFCDVRGTVVVAE